MMELAGAVPEQAARDAGFLLGFRIVGCAYILGNALGVLALLRRSWAWLFWVVLTVNLTQAAGVLMIPPEMWEAAGEAYGVVGVLPSAVTDGGALLLGLLLVGALMRYRRPWALRGSPAAAAA